MNNFAENKNIYIYKHVKKTKHMAISHLRVNNRETPRQIDAGSMQSTYCYCTYFSEETHIYWLILHKLMNCPENKLCLSFFMSIVNAVSKNTIGLRCCLFFFLIPENFFVCIHQTKKKKKHRTFFSVFYSAESSSRVFMYTDGRKTDVFISMDSVDPPLQHQVL